MTGVAALLSPSGPRHIILNDLSPAAVHIARNYCTPCDVEALETEFTRIQAAAKEEFDWLYETYHEDPKTGEKIPAIIQYTIWSDVYECRPKKRDPKKHPINPDGCGGEIVLWDVAIDKNTGTVLENFKCPHCGESWKKLDLGLLKSVPVVSNYSYSDGKAEKSRRGMHAVTEFELRRLAEIGTGQIPYWYPTDTFDSCREMWRGVHRDKGITKACDFYTKRSLWALAKLWEEAGRVENPRVADMVRFAITGTIQAASRMNRHRPNSVAGILMGTLYVGSLLEEANVLRLLKPRIDKSIQLASTIPSISNTCLTLGHAGEMPRIVDSTIDYIFTDPPFGSNIFYGDCSFLWESWLGAFTDESQEAVWNKSRKPAEGGKTLEDYEHLMSESFREMYRVLKPNRWATVVFSNSDDQVWEAIQNAAHEAGFVIYGGKEFDKVQRSFKGIKGEKGKEKVISKDVLLNLHKPRMPLVRSRELTRIEDVEGFILQEIKTYLQYLPPDASSSGRTVDAITRAVQVRVLESGCSMKGFSAAYVSDVLHEARRRLSLAEINGAWYPSNGLAGEILVRNESSAVLWLTKLLSKQGRRLDEIDPLWKQEKLRGGYHGTRGLQDLLEHFFMKNEAGTYRVPDDHERQLLRGQQEERQLRECEHYLQGKRSEEPSPEDRFAWIELLAATRAWQVILDIEKTLASSLGWQDLPGGKEARERIRLARAMVSQPSKTSGSGSQSTLF